MSALVAAVVAYASLNAVALTVHVQAVRADRRFDRHVDAALQLVGGAR